MRAFRAEDGLAFPGTWPVNAVESEVTGLAIAQIRGDGVREIVSSGRNWQVNALYGDGSVLSGWPNETTEGWYIFSKPIIGTTDTGSPDVVLAARGRFAWSWGNFGSVNPGWPKYLEEPCHFTAAYGDADNDGSAEIVFLTGAHLHMVDVGVPVDYPYFTWPMAGYGPERTSCADCQINMSAVEGEDAEVSRLQFAVPVPNPIMGEARFSFALPVCAVVELNIFDVGGRRIGTISPAEQPAGNHQIVWDGCDGSGQPVPGGQYLAALVVQGPGLKETLTRKITLIR